MVTSATSPWAMCDASMGHVRRIRGPQAAGSISHVRRLNGPCATAPWATGGWHIVVSRRCRRHATAASSDFFCVPFGEGAPAGASLHLRLPLRRRRPMREYADCTYGSDCTDCGPRMPAAASTSVAHTSRICPAFAAAAA